MEQQDVWYNILLQSDIDDLKHFCITNTNTKNICYDKRFWFEKALLHHVPEQFLNLPQKPSDWIKLLTINEETDILLQVILREFELENIITISTGPYGKISHELLPFLKMNFDLTFIGISKDYDKIYLDTEVLVNDDYQRYSKVTHVYEIKDLLIILMYHYPQLEIVDETGHSFFLIPLKHDLDRYKKNKALHHQYLNFLNIDNVTLYQYLKDRLDFLINLTNNKI